MCDVLKYDQDECTIGSSTEFITDDIANYVSLRPNKGFILHFIDCRYVLSGMAEIASILFHNFDM